MSNEVFEPRTDARGICKQFNIYTSRFFQFHLQGQRLQFVQLWDLSSGGFENR